MLFVKEELKVHFLCYPLQIKFHAIATILVKMVGLVMEPCWNTNVPVLMDIQEVIVKVGNM